MIKPLHKSCICVSLLGHWLVISTQRLFLSVLAGSRVSQLQGHSTATKAHAWNRGTEGDPQSFPVAQLRKRMFLPLCILGKKYLRAKKYHHFQEGQSALDSLQRLRRCLGRSISLWDLASPWANGAWLTSFLSKWFSRQWQGELDLCNKRQGELNFYSSAVWRRICLIEKGGSEDNSERAAVNEQKLTARSRLQHGPGEPGDLPGFLGVYLLLCPLSSCLIPSTIFIS